MKRTMLILSRIFLAGIMLLTIVQSTTITSASYDKSTNVLTITFSPCVNPNFLTQESCEFSGWEWHTISTDNILLGRMTFDDDNGGPRPDVVFSGGTILTEDFSTSELQISLIYGGIIDQYEGRDIWGMTSLWLMLWNP